jgi:hypothetical protein
MGDDKSAHAQGSARHLSPLPAFERAFHASIGTEYAAIARTRAYHHVTVRAGVEIQTEILRDWFAFGMTAFGTGNKRLLAIQ